MVGIVRRRKNKHLPGVTGVVRRKNSSRLPDVTGVVRVVRRRKSKHIPGVKEEQTHTWCHRCGTGCRGRRKSCVTYLVSRVVGSVRRRKSVEGRANTYLVSQVW